MPMTEIPGLNYKGMGIYNGMEFWVRLIWLKQSKIALGGAGASLGIQDIEVVKTSFLVLTYLLVCLLTLGGQPQKPAPSISVSI